MGKLVSKLKHMRTGLIGIYRSTDVAGALLMLLIFLSGIIICGSALVATLTGSYNPEPSLKEKIDLLSPKEKTEVEDYVDYLYYLRREGMCDKLTTGRYIFDDQYFDSNTKLRSSSSHIQKNGK